MSLDKLPTVSVIITTYRESAKPYLDLCVRSALQLSYPRELLDIVIVAPKAYAPQYPGTRTVSPPESEYGMPRGLNYGMNASSSEYMFVVNDDVILTNNCLAPLVNWLRQSREIGLLMPIGNDQQGRYYVPLAIRGPYTAADVDSNAAGGLMQADASLTYPPVLMFHDTLCLYAFLIRREVFAKVGPFDENLIGQDDIDYSLRMRQAGYLNAIALDSLVWHAGGASNTLTAEQREKSMRIFNEKWGEA